MSKPELAQDPRAKLLVIDDEPAVLKLVQAMLSKAKFQVQTASSGPEGLRLLDDSFFDCVITDAVMPMMNGFDLVRAIRRHPRQADIPVLMLTRKRHRQDVKQAVEVGVTDYVLKPIDEHLLLDKVELCLNKGENRQRQLFELALTGEEAVARMELPIIATQISETGLTLRVPVPVTDEGPQRYRIPLFDFIGITAPTLKLLKCEAIEPTPDQPHLRFEAKYAFFGCAESDLKKIRAWISRESTRRRK